MADNHGSPVLVLGVGNTLLGDDGLGIHLLEQLCRSIDDSDGAVEFLEGGTRGLALLGSIAGRSALVLLDAVSLGSVPGTVYLRRDADVLAMHCGSTTAHEGNAGELLTAARLLGDLPKHVFLVGIEPARLGSGIGLSEPVRKAIPAALEAARYAVSQALTYRLAPRPPRTASPLPAECVRGG